jgi:hypothetical protein
MRRSVTVLVLAVVAACRSVPFRVEAEHGRPTSRFRLVAAPGARINARLKPALELMDGTVLRFDSPHLTADSAYFADAPTTERALPEEAHRGVVRVCVCPSDEKVCRSYDLAVRW